MKIIKYLILIFFIAICIFAVFNIDKIQNRKEYKILEEKISPSERKEVSNYKKCIDYKLENIERYFIYRNKTKYSYCKAVTLTNIGLDKDYYTNTRKTDMSYNNLILVNKYNFLTENYEPDDLEKIDDKYFIYGNSYVRLMRKEAKEKFEELSEASIKNNTPVYGQSGYRAYSRQKELYDYAVETGGVASADSDTARPGFSEHQTGLTIDVSSTKDGNMLTFDKTESFNWMKDNAHKYGFILRYEKSKEDITGYTYESWHYRYVGVKVATDMYKNHKDLSYDEYYYRYIEKK